MSQNASYTINLLPNGDGISNVSFDYLEGAPSELGGLLSKPNGNGTKLLPQLPYPPVTSKSAIKFFDDLPGAVLSSGGASQKDIQAVIYGSIDIISNGTLYVILEVGFALIFDEKKNEQTLFARTNWISTKNNSGIAQALDAYNNSINCQITINSGTSVGIKISS